MPICIAGESVYILIRRIMNGRIKKKDFGGVRVLQKIESKNLESKLHSFWVSKLQCLSSDQDPTKQKMH